VEGGGRDFPHPYRAVLGYTQPLVQWLKRLGLGVDHQPLSSAEVKENVEVYLWDLVAGPRVNFTYFKQDKCKRGKKVKMGLF
jgi:hypothetical protein